MAESIVPLRKKIKDMACGIERGLHRKGSAVREKKERVLSSSLQV